MKNYLICSKVCLIILLLGFILAGCQQNNINQENKQIVTPEFNNSLEMPGGSTLEPFHFSTSIPDTITVKGKLLVLDPVLMLPDPNDSIFMVPMPEGGEGVATIPSFSVGEVPQAEVDERTGDYMFTDLNPGKYAIVVLTTAGAQVPARFYEQGSLAIFDIDESNINEIIELEFISIP